MVRSIKGQKRWNLVDESKLYGKNVEKRGKKMNCQKTDKQAMYDIFFGIFLCVQNFILPVFFDFYDILFIGKHRVGMLFLYFFFPFYVSYIYWDKGKWGKVFSLFTFLVNVYYIKIFYLIV